jgi:tetratricopeptide (TPR) repeat protein
MKTKSCLIICALLVTYIIASCTEAHTNEKVFEAYELRINGQADSAKILLEELLSTDSTNAMAWYELCRTTMHLGLANPREIKESINKALKCINKSVKYDPLNAWYLSYKGNMETLKFYMALQTGDENAKKYLEKIEKTFNTVFEMDPSFTENKGL